MQVLGGEREAAVCRELTKKFEEVLRGSLVELVAEFRDKTVKGEIVVLIDRNRAVADTGDTLDAELRKALLTLSLKDAVAAVSEALNIPRRTVYQAALKLEETK